MTTIWFVACVLGALVVGAILGKKSSLSARTGQSKNTDRNEVASSVDEVTTFVDEQMLKAFDLLPIGVAISRGPNGELLRNRIAREMTGVRHVDILVDEAVVALVKETIEIGEQNKSMQVAGPPDRFFQLNSQRLNDDGVVVTIEDTTIPTGRKVLLLYWSANRDERQFGPDAGELNVTRRPRNILTFSHGAHHCLGAAAARMQSRIALTELLARCPDFEVDEAGIVWAGGSYVRRPLSVPVRC